MRSLFYIAVAVAVFARSSAVAAFTNADDSQLLSKTTPDFATDAMASSDSRKRFLRATDPEDGDLQADGEERTKFKSLADIIKHLDDQKMKHVAEILANMENIHHKNALAKALESGRITQKNYDDAIAALQRTSK
ncbi:hypothetical protein L917_21684 [Phytophthora nicotianae]|uniref:RxLR effector protein n=2 Tax=Phytophthora nicotianae TaxID=4792 RepID=V9G1F0_PHYNI|nr:hypothetical protein F443_00145 [Phytophthora nicotianae P1569]ETI57580.1 hypothetical protein F443_00146 [Phytophthora nicotianae P1569]ETL77375.1 hypothetical protein L917_21684 [Phytophthora nicotianae]ETM56973.1 hypothetical protein L914_00136 [Phytophthora nicotianae]